jgi:predicted nicotinamide N-methyase
MNTVTRLAASAGLVGVAAALHQGLSHLASLWASPYVVAQLQSSQAAAVRAQWLGQPQTWVNLLCLVLLGLALIALWAKRR